MGYPSRIGIESCQTHPSIRQDELLSKSAAQRSNSEGLPCLESWHSNPFMASADQQRSRSLTRLRLIKVRLGGFGMAAERVLRRWPPPRYNFLSQVPQQQLWFAHPNMQRHIRLLNS